jgi:hypothetical protein
MIMAIFLSLLALGIFSLYITHLILFNTIYKERKNWVKQREIFYINMEYFGYDRFEADKQFKAIKTYSELIKINEKIKRDLKSYKQKQKN